MHSIDLTPLWPWLNGALAILLGGLAIYLSSYIKAFLASHTAFLDKSTEALMSQTIDNALKAGVLYAMNFVTTEEGKSRPSRQIRGLLQLQLTTRYHMLLRLLRTSVLTSTRWRKWPWPAFRP